MIISLVIGDSDATYRFVDGYFFHQYHNNKRTVENFYFYDSAYLSEKSEKIYKKSGEEMCLVYGNHFRYSSYDTSFSIITISTKRTLDSLIIDTIRFKPYIDTMSIPQYVSKRGEPYYIVYLLKQEGATWQQVDVLMTFLHETGHNRDPVANLRANNDKEKEADRIRDELLIYYFKLAKTLLNFKTK